MHSAYIIVGQIYQNSIECRCTKTGEHQSMLTSSDIFTYVRILFHNYVPIHRQAPA